MSVVAGTISQPARPRTEPLSWLKPAVFTGSIVPLTVLAIRAAEGLLGADPVAESLNQFGLLALVFLIAALACTPLKLIFGWLWPMRLRKMLGLFGFFYAAMHFLTYIVLDRQLNFSEVLADILKRKFIFVGFAAFVLLIPLALTSTQNAIRRMGAKKWQRLHKLAYVSAILGLIHFFWRVKVVGDEQYVYAGILFVLLLARLIPVLRRK
jgi:methionine sulfoxide reductase heme-binding subunit